MTYSTGKPVVSIPLCTNGITSVERFCICLVVCQWTLSVPTSNSAFVDLMQPLFIAVSKDKRQMFCKLFCLGLYQISQFILRPCPPLLWGQPFPRIALQYMLFGATFGNVIYFIFILVITFLKYFYISSPMFHISWISVGELLFYPFPCGQWWMPPFGECFSYNRACILFRL